MTLMSEAQCVPFCALGAPSCFRVRTPRVEPFGAADFAPRATQRANTDFYLHAARHFQNDVGDGPFRPRAAEEGRGQGRLKAHGRGPRREEVRRHLLLRSRECALHRPVFTRRARSCMRSGLDAHPPCPHTTCLQWCGPCRKFTPLLSVCYEDMPNSDEVEVSEEESVRVLTRLSCSGGPRLFDRPRPFFPWFTRQQPVHALP